jgi:hypothetical protein
LWGIIREECYGGTIDAFGHGGFLGRWLHGEIKALLPGFGNGAISIVNERDLSCKEEEESLGLCLRNKSFLGTPRTLRSLARRGSSASLNFPGWMSLIGCLVSRLMAGVFSSSNYCKGVTGHRVIACTPGDALLHLEMKSLTLICSFNCE